MQNYKINLIFHQKQTENKHLFAFPYYFSEKSSKFATCTN